MLVCNSTFEWHFMQTPRIQERRVHSYEKGFCEGNSVSSLLEILIDSQMPNSFPWKRFLENKLIPFRLKIWNNGMYRHICSFRTCLWIYKLPHGAALQTWCYNNNSQRTRICRSQVVGKSLGCGNIFCASLLHMGKMGS